MFSTNLEIGQSELDLAIEASGSHQSRIEGVRSVGGHEHFDVTARVKAVQLVDELEHSALHFVVAAGAVVEARAADGVDLVEEDNARLFAARHLEQLADHARALAHVLLDELGADDANEAGVSAVGDGARTQRLAGARRAEHEHALGRLDAQVDELLRMEERRLDHFAQLVDLLLAAAHVAVRHVRLLLDLHHRHARIDLGRQRYVNLILVSVHSDR